jgi:hypothetical protein
MPALTYTRPSSLPTWDPDPSDVEDPGSGRKSTGHQPLDVVESKMINFKWRELYYWTRYIDDVISESLGGQHNVSGTSDNGRHTAVTAPAGQHLTIGVDHSSSRTVTVTNIGAGAAVLDVDGDLLCDDIDADGGTIDNLSVPVSLICGTGQFDGNVTLNETSINCVLNTSVGGYRYNNATPKIVRYDLYPYYHSFVTIAGSPTRVVASNIPYVRPGSASVTIEIIQPLSHILPDIPNNLTGANPFSTATGSYASLVQVDYRYWLANAAASITVEVVSRPRDGGAETVHATDTLTSITSAAYTARTFTPGSPVHFVPGRVYSIRYTLVPGGTGAADARITSCEIVLHKYLENS